MLTEENAKTKFCCGPLGCGRLGRVKSAFEIYPGNMMSGDTANALAVAAAMTSERFCIGSGCMAWRWAEDRRETKTTYAEIEKTPKAPAGEGWEPFGRAENMADGRTRRQWARLMPNRRGMCGLAGPLIELM